MSNILLNQDRLKTAKALYEHYGRPLEKEHTGEYVVISDRGKTIIGKSLSAVVTRAIEAFGKGHFVFKIGNLAVGTL